MTARRTAAAALSAAASTTATLAGLRRTRLAGRFERSNHRGETVTMLEGPAYAVGALAGVLVGGDDPRTKAAALLAGGSAGVLGAIDDLAEDTARASKGLRGHLGALRRGTLTTGALKVLGISAAGVAAAGIVLRRAAGASTAAHLVDVVVAGGVVAGSANLVNLLDLRPGRALKAVALAGAGQALAAGRAQSGVIAAGVGAAGAALPGDLGENSMLGDAGANAAGALLGVHLIATAPRWGRCLALAAIAAATLASEKVSFTRVIEATPVLRELDSLGRRPRAGA